MKIYKFFLAVTAMALSLAACQQSGEEWKPAPQVDGPAVYFPQETPSEVSLSSQETSFSIDIARSNTADNLSVTLTTSGDSLFTIPKSVQFGSGQGKVTLTIGYDLETLGFDNPQTFTIAVSDTTQTTPYGKSSVTIKAVIPSPWTSLGKGTITDNYYMEETREVEILQNDLDPTLFRLESPFVKGDKPELTLLQPGQVYKGVTVTQEGLVGYTDIDLGWDSDNGDEVYMVFPGRFTSKQDESLWLYNKVLAYQENGLPGKVQLAPMYYMFNLGGWDKTQLDGMVEIIFPGYVVRDYSVSVEYDGILTGREGELSVATTVTFGEDVESAKIACVAGTDVEAAVAGIISGEIESVSVAASGNASVALPEGEGFGKYTVVVISEGDGEAQDYAYATFNFYGAAPQDDLLQGFYSFGTDTLSVFPAGNYEYLVQGLGYADGSTWWATFDPLKSTLTVSGVEYGYEEDGAAFGGLYGFWNDTDTLVYAYENYANEESDGTDPLVFSVDPATHQLAKVLTYFQINVYQYAQGYPYVDTPFEVKAGTDCAYFGDVDEEKESENVDAASVSTLHKTEANPALRATDALVKSGRGKVGVGCFDGSSFEVVK